MSDCDPTDGSPPGSSVRGILQARILEWVAISYSKWSSWPRDWTHASHISCTGRWLLYCSHQESLGNLQGPAQNESSRPFSKECWEFQDDGVRAWNQVQGPSKGRALGDSTDSMPTTLALLQDACVFLILLLGSVKSHLTRCLPTHSRVPEGRLDSHS